MYLTHFSVGRMFANSLGDRGSIPGRVIRDTKMVPDASLLNTKHYKVRIKGKVEQSREWSTSLLYALVLLLKKRASGHRRLRSPT